MQRKPSRSLVEYDQFYYRHPEMYRNNLDGELLDMDEDVESYSKQEIEQNNQNEKHQ